MILHVIRSTLNLCCPPPFRALTTWHHTLQEDRLPSPTPVTHSQTLLCSCRLEEHIPACPPCVLSVPFKSIFFVAQKHWCPTCLVSSWRFPQAGQKAAEEFSGRFRSWEEPISATLRLCWRQDVSCSPPAAPSHPQPCFVLWEPFPVPSLGEVHGICAASKPMNWPGLCHRFHMQSPCHVWVTEALLPEMFSICQPVTPVEGRHHLPTRAWG